MAVSSSTVRIEYIFLLFQSELFVEEPMKGRQKALFTFLSFLAFPQLNLS